jgi:hypothetical protein
MAKLLTAFLTWVALVSYGGPPDPSPARASVTGVVRITAPDAPPRTPQSAYARRRSVPPQEPGSPGGAEDAVVYLEPLGNPAPEESLEPLRILQRDRTIIPYVSVARVGQAVEFPNNDDVYHNLLSLSPENRFSLGRYAPGVTERNVFGNPGVVRLFCDIHAEMAGVILVVGTPYVTRVGADGSYRMSEIPPGAYRAIAWHPLAGADTVAIDLQESATTLDFALSAGR